MKSLVCLLEEPSAKEMLKIILPKIIPSEINPVFMVFEGKQDLEKNLYRRIYAFCEPDALFLVLRDQDSGACTAVKQNLQTIVNKTGKADNTLIRIACHELESFYLGDLKAVEQGLKIKNISQHQHKIKFRNPDRLGNPAEELKKITKKHYQKIAGSRSIAPYLNVDNSNCSDSFKALINGIKKISANPYDLQEHP